MRPEFITDPDLLAFLDKHIDRSGGPDACWPWTYTMFANGYGCCCFRGATMLAHRVVKCISEGRVLGRWEFVCHACDNRSCCNPAHHFVGGSRENMLDAVAKGRIKSGSESWSTKNRQRLARGDRHGSRTKPESVRRGERNGMCKLRASDIPVIRERLAHGELIVVVARDYGVSAAAISAIHNGRTWKHIS